MKPNQMKIHQWKEEGKRSSCSKRRSELGLLNTPKDLYFESLQTFGRGWRVLMRSNVKIDTSNRWDLKNRQGVNIKFNRTITEVIVRRRGPFNTKRHMWIDGDVKTFDVKRVTGVKRLPRFFSTPKKTTTMSGLLTVQGIYSLSLVFYRV